MFFSEVTLSLAMDSFRASKVRFLLTMLGMIIGSASIMCWWSLLGLTGRQYALKTLDQLHWPQHGRNAGISGGAAVGPEPCITSTPDYMTK